MYIYIYIRYIHIKLSIRRGAVSETLQLQIPDSHEQFLSTARSIPCRAGWDQPRRPSKIRNDMLMSWVIAHKRHSAQILSALPERREFLYVMIISHWYHARYARHTGRGKVTGASSLIHQMLRALARSKGAITGSLLEMWKSFKSFKRRLVQLSGKKRCICSQPLRSKWHERPSHLPPLPGKGTWGNDDYDWLWHIVTTLRCKQ